METDTDSEHEIIDYSKEENVEATNIRRAISEWKQKQLDTIIGESQDTIELNSYLKKIRLMHNAMKNYIETNTGKEVIDKDLLTILGDPTSYSMDTRINVLHTLFRDLVEFPFTYDTTLINSFQGDDILETNIVPNK